MRRFIVPALFCFALAGSAVAADQPAQSGQADSHPCKADVAKYCADAHGDKSKMKDCMHQHESQFSAACQQHMKEHQQGHDGPHGAGKPASGAAQSGSGS